MADRSWFVSTPASPPWVEQPRPELHTAPQILARTLDFPLDNLYDTCDVLLVVFASPSHLLPLLLVSPGSGILVSVVTSGGTQSKTNPKSR